jgi:5-formaminoimidazole-4-carboxamide-1-beta-D-ribofuranosyl 5'-monophosphate synthetase
MLKLTSVKLLDNLYKKFKISNLDDSFTLQKLINRSMDLYVHNESFRKTITEHTNLKPSGSALWGKPFIML